MMYVLVGKEGDKKSAARRALTKNGFEEINLSSIGPAELAARASTPSLLGDISTFFLSGVFNDSEFKDISASLSEKFVSSPHTFVFEEEKLLKKEYDSLTKKGAIVQVFETKKLVEPFNVFLLANALQAKKKKELWILLIKALRTGIAPENITGVLHWKVRSMLSSRGSKTYSKEELVDLSRSLVTMYHDSHRGAGPLELLLEQFILTL